MHEDDFRYSIFDGGLPVRIIAIDHRRFDTENLALTAAENCVQRYQKSDFFVLVLSLKPIDKKKNRQQLKERFKKILAVCQDRCDVHWTNHTILLWNARANGCLLLSHTFPPDCAEQLAQPLKHIEECIHSWILARRSEDAMVVGCALKSIKTSIAVIALSPCDVQLALDLREMLAYVLPGCQLELIMVSFEPKSNGSYHMTFGPVSDGNGVTVLLGECNLHLPFFEVPTLVGETYQIPEVPAEIA